MQINNTDSYTETLLIVAKLMEVSARTAPKAKGTDVIVIKTASGNELSELSESMKEFGTRHHFGFFLRDAENVKNSACCLLIGAAADGSLGLNCQGCGFATCREMHKKQIENLEKLTHSNSDSSESENTIDGAFIGPNCIIRQADLGIAVCSAAKTASMHNVDNRIMFTAGVGALKLGWLENCTVAYGIPLSASGKNLFFDRSH